MRRHKSFSSEGEAIEYLRGMVPAHVYHSAAYYQFPGAGTMKEKKWEGADLIFDLDADHLPQKARSYAEMLANVKSETSKLLDFLLDDFGFGEDTIRVAFSGGRGYHIHVHDPRVLTLESPQRREIVDYLSGTGLTLDFLFIPAKHTIHDMGKFRKPELESSRRISSFDDVPGGYGWGKRISRYIIHFLKDISRKDEADAINDLIDLVKKYYSKKVHEETLPNNTVMRIIQMKREHQRIRYQKIADELGISKDKVIEVLNNIKYFRAQSAIKLKELKEIAENPKAIDMIENGGFIDFPETEGIFDAIVQKAIEENSISLGSAHTDEPVTADIRRLIRMPSSLHGGSGMRVVPLTLSEFEKFEPLRDAVVFSEKEIKIEVIPPLKPQNSVVEMKGKSIKVEEGINTVPEYAGIYLMCRGAAEYDR